MHGDAAVEVQRRSSFGTLPRLDSYPIPSGPTVQEYNAPPTRPEILAIRAVAQCGTIRAAAEALCLSPHTVDAHLDRLRAKSGLRYLPQLVAWAAANGWLSTDAESDAQE